MKVREPATAPYSEMKIAYLPVGMGGRQEKLKFDQTQVVWQLNMLQTVQVVCYVPSAHVHLQQDNTAVMAPIVGGLTTVWQLLHKSVFLVENK